MVQAERVRFTRRTDKRLRGSSHQQSVRFPQVLYDEVMAELDQGITDVRTFSEAVQDALSLWVLYERRSRNGK